MSLSEVTSGYYQARDAMNFGEIKSYVADSITIVEGDYIMPYDMESYHEVFKWDSIFQTSYQLLNTQKEDGEVIASVRLKSIRNSFLKSDSMTCNFKLSFIDNQITRIQTMGCTGVDWSLWETQRDELVGWIKENHQELVGFEIDMTQQGAQNYLRAINWYKDR